MRIVLVSIRQVSIPTIRVGSRIPGMGRGFKGIFFLPDPNCLLERQLKLLGEEGRNLQVPLRSCILMSYRQTARVFRDAGLSRVMILYRCRPEV
jgi:hypothetical protein